ncbi:MAG: hypothetical protein GSR78_04785 [Desulfurococcales archaeon]|nr:hypothetical protein [Desulfurococcales archaeon]
MRLLGLLLLALLLGPTAAGGLTGHAEVTIVNPKMEQYRDVVGKAGIRDWPIAYRGHILYVEAEYSASTAVPPEPCDGCDAGPPSLAAELIYDGGQFLLLNETLEVNVTSSSRGNWTVYTAVALYRAELMVRHNASVFQEEDWSGNYTREEVYIVWRIEKPVYSCQDANCTNYTINTVSSTVEDRPEPRFMRLYARQPGIRDGGMGILAFSEIAYADSCSWDGARVTVSILNPGTGIPGPGSRDWQLVARLRPGQLIVEGLTVEAVLVDPGLGPVAAASWTGDLHSYRPIELVLEPEAAGLLTRFMEVAYRVGYILDLPGGPSVGVEDLPSSTVGLPSSWLIVDEPPAAGQVAIRGQGREILVGGPWPARVCLEPGVYSVSCSGCLPVVVDASLPQRVMLQPAPVVEAPGPAAGGGGWLLLLAVSLGLLVVALGAGGPRGRV